MKIKRHYIDNLFFFLHFFFLVLIILDQYILVPFWLMPLGRLHPLVLHFPVVLIVILSLFLLTEKQFEKDSFLKIQTILLDLSVFTTVVAGIMGFLLMKEDSGISSTGLLHRTLGSIMVFSTYFLYLFQKKKALFKWGAFTLVFLVIGTGHFGASLTHGSDFITAPLQQLIPKEEENLTVFEAEIKPILKKKCASCHNAEKKKADYDMSTLSSFIKGGENGVALIMGNAKESNLMRTINLPIDHEEHMPPKGKSQLTQKEINALTNWIQNGDTTLLVNDLKNNFDFSLTKNITLQLNQPIMVNQKNILAKGSQVLLEHKIKGVDLYYTLDDKEPDASSILYTKPITIDSALTLKVVAKKEGWLDSKVFKKELKIEGYIPDSAYFLSPPIKFYEGLGITGLYDSKNGSIHYFPSKYWTGFDHKKKCFAVFNFGDTNANINEIIIGYAKSRWQLILDPKEVRIYGETEEKAWALIQQKVLKNPTDFKGNSYELLTLSLPKNKFKKFKIEIDPVVNTPKWHWDKKKVPRVFIDEIVFR